METKLDFDIFAQPDDTTCGPTCLHALYRYYGDDIPLAQVIDEVQTLDAGGTLAVLLACHALQRGYSATIYTYNLHLFDPTWFSDEGADIPARLKAQASIKVGDPRMAVATEAYIEFLARGGNLRFQDLTAGLIRNYLKHERPILTGLSATYLYQSARENQETMQDDDVGGEPTGHFVVLCGYHMGDRTVHVADPHLQWEAHHYDVTIDRIISSILLGVITYDANLLIIEPRKRR